MSFLFNTLGKYIRPVLPVMLILFCCMGAARAQFFSINGSTCVGTGNTYAYLLFGASSSAVEIWSVTGGSFSGAYYGTNLTMVHVIWSTTTTGTVSVSTATPVGNASLSVHASSPMVAGTISNPSQTVNNTTVPATINCSVASGGCGSSPAYNWQKSTDGTNYSATGVTTQNLAFSAALAQTTYFKRVATDALSGLTGTTSVATVTITYPPLNGGTVSPGSQSLNYNTASSSLALSGVSGGSGTYGYQWQSSPNSSFSSPANVGTNSSSYAPGALTATTYYRVMVTSAGQTAYSTTTLASVYPQLLTGTIAPAAATLTYNTGAPTLTLSGVSRGNGSFSYQWQSAANSSFSSPVNVGTKSLSYAPGTLTATTYYQVLVTSNGLSLPSASSTITVMPQLTAGTVSGPSSVTYNSSVTFSSTQGAGGGNCAGSYGYQWFGSTDGVNYQSIGGANAAVYWTNLRGTGYFKRQVVCGTETVWSNVVYVQVSPQFYGGSISPGALTITSGTGPGLLTGDPASGGNCGGSYSYQWQQSTDGINYTTASGSSTAQNYTPAALTATTWFRRRAVCGTDTSYTNVCVITVGTIPATADMNYIRVRDIKKPLVTDTVTADGLSDPNDVNQTTQFMDGLGRPVQTVGKQASPKLKDMVSPVVYDQFGRVTLNYLPYVSVSSDGNYRTNALPEQNAFNAIQFSGEQYYYGQTDYESSPLNRVLAAYAPGGSWVGQGRGIASQFLTNGAADSVQIWKINMTPGSLPADSGALCSRPLIDDPERRRTTAPGDRIQRPGRACGAEKSPALEQPGSGS